MSHDPAELAEDDQELAERHKVHVHIDCGSDSVDGADQDHLDENLENAPKIDPDLADLGETH